MSYQHLFMNASFPKSHLGNGIGRYVGQLQRVTLKFCKNHGASRGMREFLENDLINFAKENPGVVVYVKPRRHRMPVIKAEYLNGEYHWISCRKFTRDEVVKHMELVKTQTDNGSASRLRKFAHTDFPSIQGPWTPFTFRDPKLNVTNFPNKELGAHPVYDKSATQKILEMYKAQQQEKEIAEGIQNLQIKQEA